MNIRTLKIFLDLVDNANFSKTAKQNGVSQSAISQKLKFLEKRLNVDLLEKKQKSFQLTQDGVVFYRHAKLIVSEYDVMLENLHNHDSKILSGVSLLMSYWMGIYVLPHYIREYLKISKNFNLDVNYIDYTRMQGTNWDSKADLILFELPSMGEGMITEPFAEDEFVVVCSEQAVPKTQQIFSLSQFESSRLIGFSKHHPLRYLFETAIGKKIHCPRYFMELNQIELIKEAIEIHNGIAVLPKSSVFSSYSGHLLRVMPLESGPIPIPLYLIYRKDQKKGRALERFVEILKGKPLLF